MIDIRVISTGLDDKPLGIITLGFKRIPRYLLIDGSTYKVSNIESNEVSYSFVHDNENKQMLIDMLQPTMTARSFEFFKISKPILFKIDRDSGVHEIKTINIYSLVYDMSVINLYLHYNRLSESLDRMYMSKVREWVASPFKLSVLIDKYESSLESSLVEVVL